RDKSAGDGVCWSTRTALLFRDLKARPIATSDRSRRIAKRCKPATRRHTPLRSPHRSPHHSSDTPEFPEIWPARHGRPHAGLASDVSSILSAVRSVILLL